MNVSVNKSNQKVVSIFSKREVSNIHSLAIKSRHIVLKTNSLLHRWMFLYRAKGRLEELRTTKTYLELGELSNELAFYTCRLYQLCKMPGVTHEDVNDQITKLGDPINKIKNLTAGIFKDVDFTFMDDNALTIIHKNSEYVHRLACEYFALQIVPYWDQPEVVIDPFAQDLKCAN